MEKEKIYKCNVHVIMAFARLRCPKRASSMVLHLYSLTGLLYLKLNETEGYRKQKQKIKTKTKQQNNLVVLFRN